jgi:hypothetical protein
MSVEPTKRTASWRDRALPTAVVDFTEGDPVLITAISGKRYRALLAEHPAPKGTDLAFSVLTFPPALIAACLGISADEGVELWEQWSSGDAVRLFSCCQDLCNGQRVKPLPK